MSRIIFCIGCLCYFSVWGSAQGLAAVGSKTKKVIEVRSEADLLAVEKAYAVYYPGLIPAVSCDTAQAEAEVPTQQAAAVRLITPAVPTTDELNAERERLLEWYSKQEPIKE